MFFKIPYHLFARTLLLQQLTTPPKPTGIKIYGVASSSSWSNTICNPPQSSHGIRVKAILASINIHSGHPKVQSYTL
jgi:hypothetical protein